MKSRKIVRGTLVAVFAVSSFIPLVGQTNEQTIGAKKPCTLPGVPADHIREVQDAAYALPASLRAVAMIRVAIKVSSACPTLAKDLLQGAFEQANSVDPETSYKQASGALMDSRLSYAAHAYDLRADRLSLQARAVMAMIPLDSKSAIKLFRTIAPPHPPIAGCANAFVSDVSIYYEAFSKILTVLRPTTPKNNAEAHASYAMLEDMVRATSSPVQLAPVASVLQKVNLRDTEIASLLNALAAAIEQFPADDRSFNGARISASGSPAQAIENLVALANKSGASSYSLIRSFRDYLDRSMRGPHCEDAIPKQPKDLMARYSFFVDRFAKSADLAPISMPSGGLQIEPHPDEGQYWLSPKTKELLEDGKHLNFDDNWQRFSNADKKTPEWRDRVERLLNHMDRWYPEDEASPADYFHQRCILAVQILSHLQPGPLYDRVVGAWVSTLEASSLQFDRPAEWYYEVTQFLNSSRKDKKDPIAPDVLVALKRSNNAYLHASGVVAEFLN